MAAELLGAGDAATSEDFVELLRKKGLYSPRTATQGAFSGAELAGAPHQTQATTILAFKFSEGVLVAGDRRATAGNLVVYEHADKVLEIDSHSLMAIAGVPATAWEMARTLEHSFQFYRRSQLQEMSVDGKVRALSKLLRDNLGLVMQGVGVVVPIFATYDIEHKAARLYFYDAMGAQFETADYAATGSGSAAVRSVLYYQNLWGKGPMRQLERWDALILALRALDTASEMDTATGGVDRRGRSYPMVKIVSEKGITTLSTEEVAEGHRQQVS